MTFIMNNKQDMITSYLHAITYTYKHLQKHPDIPLIYTTQQTGIPILSGGGSGHEPSHVGFIGEGMLSGALCGSLFTPPTSTDILKAIQFLDKGQGVFIIIKNFEADMKQFDNAIQQARQLGHSIKYILSHDDISIEPKNFHVRGRGLAGTILLHKILGYAAKNGASLNHLEEIGLHLATQIATIGFATKSASLPKAALPLFDLAENNISYGIGIHGEEGYKTVPFQSSEQLANEIVNKLKLHFHWQSTEQYALLINNLGTTTDLEMGIFLNDIKQLLDIEALSIPFIKMGKYMTSLDMTGISVTLCKLTNDNWLNALHEPTTAFAW